ncbi:MAG: ATP-binding cassette domain-containing protein [Actinomycetota bacterium]|nr:ATP-binding cassette domain-containing protein [Actinomycetota bacterium]
MNIEINDGEFVVLVGSSGCGKTTLLRIVVGLEDIREGETIDLSIYSKKLHFFDPETGLAIA